MRKTISRSLGLVALVGALSLACTSQEPGNPGPADTGAAPSKTSSTAPVESTRPKEIKLDGIDPCKVLTTDQMKQLSVVQADRNDSDLVDTGDVPVCDYSTNGSPRFSYGVGLVTAKGIEYWRGSGNVDVRRTDVGDYNAVELTLSGTENSCAVSVDVAEGQQLYVDYRPIGQKPSQEQMCQNAKKAAEFALVTLPTLA
ncbi:DUF3558 domain-containing protein [Saccharothrix coeruleofusca]|uniref:DUF3558 domain-containing protein n=1 Tax=Saccharothrix coeruleofusca TaxID=33919 RepID=A0A918ASA3_9PSEU|nr:DUF3558 domain-containing protein [Saccharothrix coeruleofusca]GGP80638.1 hypothetical protein GCM10010185_63150 [Saccharothrix coeruleofusca]